MHNDSQPPFSFEIDRPELFGDALSRREWLQFTGAGLAILPFGVRKLMGLAGENSVADDPIGALQTKKFPILVAFLEAQMHSLWCGPLGDSPHEAACDFIRFVSHLPERLQQGVCYALTWFDFYSLRKTHHHFATLSNLERRRLLNQGETPRCQDDPPLICWSEEHLMHTAVSSLAMLGRLVTLSRQPARDFVGLSWSSICEEPGRAVHVPEPPPADLDLEYDVCVIGSGAGGALVASRAAAAGLRVVIIEAGDYVSPDALVTRVIDANGAERLQPPRCDEVLMRLYKHAGVQIAGGISDVENKADVILPHRRRKIRPKQTINVVQAQVVGGGPYVNNAIHLRLARHVWDSWGDGQPAGVSFEDFSVLMERVEHDLGVNKDVTDDQVSERSLRFAQGCNAAGEAVAPLPVAIRKDCTGCGADNSVDTFGDHIGGVHPYRPGAANSYLMRALHEGVPARVASKTHAVRANLRGDVGGGIRADSVDVIDRRDNPCGQLRRVRAKKFVVAAGVGATSTILRSSMCAAGLYNRHLGARLTGNVGTAIYAMYDKPIWPHNSGRPEPGVTQCFVVERRMEMVNGQLCEIEPTLENWFHFPGTVAVALTGWFEHYGSVMRRFNHLSMAGMVTPTHVRPQNYVAADGKLELALDQAEFERLLRGLRRLGQIYLATSTPEDSVQLFLPTKAILMRNGCPVQIRTLDDLDWAIAQIRCRGAAFLNMLTAHPQGGASLGSVVNRETFQVQTDDGRCIDNLYVADASVLPAGCEINPQLTIKALAHIAADRMLSNVM